MTSRKGAVSVLVVAAGLVALSGCGGEKATGLPAPTPSPGSHSSSSAPPPATAPVAVPAPPSTWTPAQEVVIDTTLTYRELVSKYSRGSAIDRSELRSVTTEPFAAQVESNIAEGLAYGFILYGDEDVDEIRAVTIKGEKSTLTECWIGLSYGVKKSASPPITAKPAAPSIVNISLTRSAGTWLVSGSTEGGACTAMG